MRITDIVYQLPLRHHNTMTAEKPIAVFPLLERLSDISNHKKIAGHLAPL